MRRIKRLIAVAIPLVSVFSVLAPTPAQATQVIVGEAVATGTGTINNGLTLTTPAMQTVDFTGRVTGTVAAASTTAPGGTTGVVAFDMNCQFNGGSNTPETSLSGEGTVTGNCTGTGVFLGVNNGTAAVGLGTITVNCATLFYTRRGGEVLVSGACRATATVNNVAGGTVTVTTNFCVLGEFLFVPTSAPVTTSYALAGSVTSYSQKLAACQNVKTLPIP